LPSTSLFLRHSSGPPGVKVSRICRQVSCPPSLAKIIASRPRISLFGIQFGNAVQRRCTASVCPARDASMSGVWCSSFKEMPSHSWFAESRTLMIGTSPREEARWREVFESPVGVESGLWRRCGCVFRMRETRRGSEAWIARRRRREGSILLLLIEAQGRNLGRGYTS
jgi:hypothetical protein